MTVPTMSCLHLRVLDGEWSIHTSFTLTKYSNTRMSRMRTTKVYGKRFLISYII